MTTYNTMNPVPSSDARDRYDNSENLDNFSNGPLDAYPDRFGVSRQSLQGIRNASQYVELGPYAAGLVFTSRNQVFSYNPGTGAEFYSPGPSITLPYTTTGVGAGEIAAFRSVGDAILRSDLAASAGSSLIGFLQAGTGAVARTVQSKVRDTISVIDFGAVGDGVTNNLDAISAAIVAAGSGRTIHVPVDSAGGDYAITSGTLTIPSTASFTYEGGARFLTAGGAIIDNGNHFHLFGGGAGEHRQDTLTTGVALELNAPLTGVGQGGSSSTYMLNRILIKDDRLDAVNDDAAGTKVDGLMVQHGFGGAGTRGGRHGVEVHLVQNAPTEADNTDRNYVGIQGYVASAVGDGGTLGNEKGAYFGSSSYAKLSGTATHAMHVTGCEFDAGIFGGASAKYRAGATFVSMGDNQGYLYDAGVAIGALGTTGAQWKDGILVGIQNGRQPVSRALIRNECNAGTLISHSGAIPPRLITSDTDARFNFRVDQLEMYYANASVRLGSKTAANTPYVDFFTDASGNSAGRLLATGTATIAQNGVLNIQFRQTTTRELVPSADNTFTLGSTTLRWGVIYAATGTINTSDENAKQQIKPIDAAALRAWGKVDYQQYKFNDSVEEKGKAARWHFGVIAQRVVEAFESEGISAFDYGLLCYDEWPEVQEVLSDDGEVITAYQEAGSRYGIRYEEALALECAYLRSMLAK